MKKIAKWATIAIIALVFIGTFVFLFQKSQPKQTQYEIGHFADCILENKRPITDGPSALQGLRVIWKLYEAEKNGVVADLRGLGLPKRD